MIHIWCICLWLCTSTFKRGAKWLCYRAVHQPLGPLGSKNSSSKTCRQVHTQKEHLPNVWLWYFWAPKRNLETEKQTVAPLFFPYLYQPVTLFWWTRDARKEQSDLPWYQDVHILPGWSFNNLGALAWHKPQQWAASDGLGVCVQLIEMFAFTITSASMIHLCI